VPSNRRGSGEPGDAWAEVTVIKVLARYYRLLSVEEETLTENPAKRIQKGGAVTTNS
jgi:hypothetical protein